MFTIARQVTECLVLRYFCISKQKLIIQSVMDVVVEYLLKRNIHSLFHLCLDPD